MPQPRVTKSVVVLGKKDGIPVASVKDERFIDKFKALFELPRK